MEATLSKSNAAVCFRFAKKNLVTEHEEKDSLKLQHVCQTPASACHLFDTIITVQRDSDRGTVTASRPGGRYQDNTGANLWLSSSGQDKVAR